MNGGFFVLRNEIFDYIREGEELVLEPFQRLMRIKKLTMYCYDGFWGCMDTFKEKQHLDDLFHSGLSPWEVWKAAKQTTVIPTQFLLDPLSQPIITNDETAV